MNLRFSKLYAGFAALVLLCMQTTSAEAIFASIKATGMAATCIAYPQDSLVGAYNPAGMACVGDRFDLEAAWVYDRGYGKVKGNRSPFAPLINGSFNGMRTHCVYPAGFGVNKTFCLCDLEMSLGLILYNRNYQKTTYSKPFPLLGTSHLGLEYLHQTVAPIFTVTFCQRHSLGIAVNYQLERVKVNGIENFDVAPIPGRRPGSVHPGHVTNKGYDYSSGWTPTIGYYGQLTDCLAVGVTYQPETSMRKMHKYDGFLAHHGKLNIPQKIGAGISYRVIPCVVVAFDVEHIHWGPIKSLSNNLLHDGALEPLGSNHGPGFGFRDQMYYRVGIDWQINNCWAVRAGFRHARTPIKKSQTAVNLLTLDCVEDFVTVGATWYINRCNEISALFAWGFEHNIHGEPTNIPVFLGGGQVDLKEQKYALGLAWGYKF